MPKVATYTLAWYHAQHAYQLLENQHKVTLDIVLESPAWFAWLAEVSSFAFAGAAGSCTVRKETTQRGGGYWYAYLRTGTKLTKKYLGKTADVRLARLEEVVELLQTERGAARPARQKMSPTIPQREAPPSKAAEDARVVSPVLVPTPPTPLHPHAEPLTPLLSTKLHIPRPRAQLVPRFHLVRRLQQGVAGALTLITAPAGFGKTTLLAQWLAESSTPAAWLSLEPQENEPVRFLLYLIAALQTLDPRLGRMALPLLQTPHPAAPETVLTLLTNDVVSFAPECGDFALVLEDYHVIEAAPIHQALLFLVEHLPPQMHLILLTRADPPLPLSRLRARGQLTELRAAELRFAIEEVEMFLRTVMGLDLSTEDMALLQKRTEGWIAGLQFAALSLRGRTDVSAFLSAFSGSHRFVLDYLTDEVLTRQPTAVQAFLLSTSILERLSGPLCDQVTGQGGSQAMLEAAERANLFVVSLDDERQWYRYHHLFADLLRHRLHQTMPARVPELHRRASTWYEQQGLVREAVYHALAAADFVQGASLIEHNAELVAQQGELTTLRTWLEALPDELIRSRVELGLWHGWLLTQTGQYDAAERLLQGLERYLHPGPTSALLPAMIGAVDPPRFDEPQKLIEYAGRVAAIRAFIAFKQGDIPRTIELALEALRELPKGQAFRGLVAWYLGIAYRWNGNLAAGTASLTEASKISRETGDSYVACMAAFELAQLQAEQGALHQADQSYQRALELGAARGGHLAATGPAYVGRGDLQREWDHLEEAAGSLQEGIAQCQQTGNAAIRLHGHIALARVRQAQGDAVEADRLIRQIPQLLRSSSLSPVNAAQSSAWYARLALAQGDLAEAARWLQERKLEVEDALSSPRDIEYQTLARVLIAQHRPREALPLLDRLLHLVERQGLMGSALEYLVLQALAIRACGDEVRALERLARALALAEPEGYIHLFVDEGEPMVALLRQAFARGIAPAYIATLISAAGAPALPDPAPARSLLEPLTEREREVLRLLVSGLSNAAMAQEMVITVGTIKRHVNSIYGKLGVNSRTQAIARAHTLHML